MKTYIYNDTSFPVGMATTKRISCYARGLLANGMDVLVVPYRKSFEYKQQNGVKDQGSYDGIEYEYPSGCFKRNKHNKILRFYDWEVGDALRGACHILRNVKNDDIVFIYVHSVFAQLVLMMASCIKHAKIVKEICEHPSALCNMNKLGNRIARWFEYNFIFPCYDGFVPISRDLDMFVSQYKKKTAKTVVVPILVEDSLFNIDFTTHQSLYKVPYIIHTGTMLEPKDSISKIIKAFALYKKKHPSNIRLVFTGPHANDSCSYIPLMNELGVRSDIDLLGLVSMTEVAVLQHYSALTIIYKSDNLQTRNCFPTKLGEMLMSGTPVITTTIGDANLYLKNGESAFIIEPDDESRLIQCIDFLLSNPQQAKVMGEKGRQVAQECFSPVYQGKKLTHFFKNL